MGVGVLLQKFKEVQRYAVVDLGDEGLADEAERRFRTQDFSAILREIQKQSETGSLQDELRDLAAVLDGVKEPEDFTGEHQLALLNWTYNQPPEVQAKINGISTSQRYEYVDPDELGITATEPTELRKALTKPSTTANCSFPVLGADPLKDPGLHLVCDNQTDDALRKAYQDTLTKLVREARIEDADISRSVAERLQERVGSRARRALRRARTRTSRARTSLTSGPRSGSSTSSGSPSSRSPTCC